MSYTPLNDPIFTGDPRGVTASPGDNDTSLATTEFVQGELGNFLPLAGGTMSGNIILDPGVNLELADDGAIDWNGNASLSYDSGADVLSSDSAIRVSIAPSDDNDLTNKAYVDSVATGLDVKESVRVASQADVDISAPGAAIDGVTLANGDRVLLKAQDAGEENGIYEFNGAAVPMTRAADADSNAEVNAGMFTFVEEGTNADQGWVLTTNNPIDLGVDAIAFSQFSNAVIVSTLDSLTDVDVSGVVDGALLRYDSAGGGGWADTTNLLLDDNGRLAVSATGVNGGIMIGGDVHLYRFQADVLYTPDNVAIGSDLIMSNTDSDISFTNQDDATNLVVKSKLAADTVNRLAMQADGKMLWGDGTNAADVNLYRDAADILKTDDSLEVAGSVFVAGVGELKESASFAGELEIAPNSALFIQGASTRISGATLQVHDDRGVSDLYAELNDSGIYMEDTDGDASIAYVDADQSLRLSASGLVRVQAPLEIEQGLRFSGKQTISANATLDANTDHVVLVDVSGGAVTVTLPAAPADGAIFQIKDMMGNAEAENITIAGNGKNIDGDASAVMGVNFQSATVIYDAAADAWFLI